MCGPSNNRSERNFRMMHVAVRPDQFAVRIPIEEFCAGVVRILPPLQFVS